MSQIVCSFGYYGNNKTKKFQGMQLSPTNTTDATLKTQYMMGGC